MRHRPLIAAAGIALTVALAGCASDGTATTTSSPPASATSSTAPTATGSATEADIAFAQLMIPHHQQAIEMADLAARNASLAEVRTLAAQIEAAQGPEIQTMTQWLADWGAPTAMPTPSDGMNHGDMDMGGMTAHGMMSAEDMAELGGAMGHDFDEMWLQMMIAHHEGAIDMAEQVLSSSTNPDVRAMAEAIISGQTAEIAHMRQLLAQ